jgi:hypothetical protein
MEQHMNRFAIISSSTGIGESHLQCASNHIARLEIGVVGLDRDAAASWRELG